MKFIPSLLLLCLLLSLNACIGTYTKPPDPKKNPWELLFAAQGKILNAHATPFEYYAISDNEFLRFNADRELLEKRPLATDFPRYGRPVLSDNTFVRLLLNAQNKQELQFHTVKNSTQLYKVLSTDLVQPDETIFLDFDARTPGAYSDDGNFYLIPAITYPNYHYDFFILKLTLNQPTTEILDISLYNRVSVPELPGDFGNIMSTRFIGGNFYVATKSGGFRVTPEGEITRLFTHWVLDFFQQGTRIYSTGFNDYDLHFSEDNGLSWTRYIGQSPLKYCEAAGDNVFSQIQSGWRYSLASEDLTVLQDLVYNTGFIEDNASYYTVDFFQEKYFISVGKEIYFVDSLEVE